ncbi:DUF803 domain membrane protein [Blumeria hordei DH14]|uniref:DUF803 domain membrane protein n=1 Tax=Blumeria graminis f. sp. hordei (strain DH14) TaxID=546991 RepID=N1J5Q7_BLUG1|nr:DUF803 domain membrane protein [Blumeria hordei DH14]
MNQTNYALAMATSYVQANMTITDNPSTQSRPSIYKAIGIALAVASGNFIGASFVLKKIGLLKANEKYGEAAGEGYGYLRNTYWWAGMILMIIGEICNFVAYAFVDAILVTPLGALSVVITTILSAIFLKERLSMVGKVGCFLCIIGSVVIVMNAPTESSVANIQEMQHFVIAPGFLSYAGVIIAGCIFIATWASPRYGKKSMMVYLSICSLIGGLSVVATQGLGAAIVAQIGGTAQFNHWFLYVLFAFVITTLVTEIIYLNVSLNLFNAALVTPTYYVFFTSSTIITSAILFRGFEGSVISILTVVMGFFVICAGVCLLQLSKSAKDVPDAAVFAGDLDQVRTIAEQEQPESEPKADAIRGTAAIVRRISSSRQKWELAEAKRLHEEKQQDLEPIGENQRVHIQWDGLRRRTTFRANNSVQPRPPARYTVPGCHAQHPPLGMSTFPLLSDTEAGNNSPVSGVLGSSIFGKIMKKRYHPTDLISHPATQDRAETLPNLVPLSEISVPHHSQVTDDLDLTSRVRDPVLPDCHLGLPLKLKESNKDVSQLDSGNLTREVGSRDSSLESETSVPLQLSPRNFSFQSSLSRFPVGMQSLSDDELDIIKPKDVKRDVKGRSVVQGASEEERLGLVMGDAKKNEAMGQSEACKFEEKEQHRDVDDTQNEKKLFDGEMAINDNGSAISSVNSDKHHYERQRQKWNSSIGLDTARSSLDPS